MAQTPDPLWTPLHEWVTREDLETLPMWHLGPAQPPLSTLSPDQRWMYAVLEGMEDPADFTVGGLRGSDLLQQADRDLLTHWYRLLIDRCWGAWGQTGDPRWPAITVDDQGKPHWVEPDDSLRFLQMLVTVGEEVVALEGAVLRDQQILTMSRRLLAEATKEHSPR